MLTTHTKKYARIQEAVHPAIDIHIKHIHSCSLTHTHTHGHIRTQTHGHRHTHTETHTHTHTRTQTHTRTRILENKTQDKHDANVKTAVLPSWNGRWRNLHKGVKQIVLTLKQ